MFDFDFDFDFFLPLASVFIPSFLGFEFELDADWDSVTDSSCDVDDDTEVELDPNFEVEFDEEPLLTSGAVVYSDSDTSTSASAFENPAITEPVALGTTFRSRPSPIEPIEPTAPIEPIEPNANGSDAAFVRLLPLMIALSSNAPLSSEVGERTMGGDLVVVFVLVFMPACNGGCAG